MSRKLANIADQRLSRRRFLGVAAVAPVGFAVMGGRAQDPIPQPGHGPAMGTIGVAAGQKLRVSVFHHHAEIPPTPCNFRINVFGINGQMLGQHVGQVNPGAGAFADFDVAALIRKPERVQVHVMVTALDDEPLESTAEVFDKQSGATRIPGTPCVIPEPLSHHRADASVGLIRGQAMRVSFFLHPSANQSPRDVASLFASLAGTTLGAFQGTVMPGQGLAIDWGDGSPGFPDLAAGERLQIHAGVRAVSPTDVVGITGEVFDLKSGETAFEFIPCDLSEEFA